MKRLVGALVLLSVSFLSACASCSDTARKAASQDADRYRNALAGKEHQALYPQFVKEWGTPAHTYDDGAAGTRAVWLFPHKCQPTGGRYYVAPSCTAAQATLYFHDEGDRQGVLYQYQVQVVDCP